MKSCKTVKFPVFINCNGDSESSQIGYEPFPTKGEITISTDETPAIIPLVNSTNAGLMSPSMFALLSSVSISTTISTGFGTITIEGTNKAGTVQFQAGLIGQSGVIFQYDISPYISNDSVLVASDMLDNYAMGHYQVAFLSINNLKRMILNVKDGITLEPSTTYKWSYQINS